MTDYHTKEELASRKSLLTGMRVVDRAPQAAWAEWFKRKAIAPRSLTAAICGDPLPGYSALDKKA